jgi:hypothetical protein
MAQSTEVICPLGNYKAVRRAIDSMAVAPDPRLIALFGSETRVRVLAVLASAFSPMTGYRVAITGGVPIPKAHLQLHHLAESGIVKHLRQGWILEDPDIGTLLRKRFQIRSLGDWESERRARRPEYLALFEKLNSLDHARPPPAWKPRKPDEFQEDPEKGRWLREHRMGRPAHD